VEEDMWEFLDLVISMGIVHLPCMKEYWSQEFVFRVPFVCEVFTRKHSSYIYIYIYIYIYMHSAGKHNRRNHDSPAHRLLNCTLYDIPPIPFVIHVTQKDPRSSLMMADYC
jgi:hypothetical protein